MIHRCFLQGENCGPVLSDLGLFLSTLVGIYVFHYVLHNFFIHPFVSAFVKRKMIARSKLIPACEGLWKFISVSFLFIWGIAVASGKPWFFNVEKYFTTWPYVIDDLWLKLYYFSYASFWLQSLDFHLSFTNNYYDIRRKDYYELLVHHVATFMLMLVSYALDFSHIGTCVLLIHDVSDIFLEGAKFLRYLNLEFLCTVVFVGFVSSWIYCRLYLFSSNILYAVFYNAYDLQKRLGEERYLGRSPMVYFLLYAFFNLFLWTLLVLHAYWSVLIARMLYRTVVVGTVGDDVRSDSEHEGDVQTDYGKGSLSNGGQAVGAAGGTVDSPQSSNGAVRSRGALRPRKMSN